MADKRTVSAITAVSYMARIPYNPQTRIEIQRRVMRAEEHALYYSNSAENTA